MPLYRAPEGDVQPGPAPAQASAGVACRCCPGGVSRSTRARRYPSNMTGAEWALCEPLLPAPAWLAGRGGRPARYCMRDIVDAIRYLTHNGPVWRALPADFPPAWTIYYWVDKWQADGSAARMHDDLRERIPPGGRADGSADCGDHRFPVGEGLGNGGARRPRLRRGEEGQRPQAAHRRRYARPAARGYRHRRQHAGPRRREAAAVEPAPPSPPSPWPGPTAGTPASSSPGPRPASP